jgi:hypothetical protein
MIAEVSGLKHWVPPVLELCSHIRVWQSFMSQKNGVLSRGDLL